MCGSVFTDSGDLFSNLRVPTTATIGPFIARAKKLGLAYDMDFQAAPSEIATTALHNTLFNQFTNFQLAFAVSPPRPPSSSTSHIETLPWTLLVTGKSQRAIHLGVLLNPYKRSLSQLTFG